MTKEKSNFQIKKLVFGGQGLAHKDGAAYFIWNTLPQEVVKAQILKKRKGIIEGVATEIIQKSPQRIKPKQKHYLSSSPWDIMKYDYELEQKIKIAQETFCKIQNDNISNIQIYSDNIQYAYRNKMEYGFYVNDKNGRIDLSLFGRGSHKPIPIKKGDLLAQKALNKTAIKIRKWVNKNKIQKKELKSLIVRSNHQGETIAGLFVKNENVKYKSLPKISKKFLGFDLYYSTHKSPASVITSTLASAGHNIIEETILNTQLKFGLMSFFQINPPVFEKTLIDISKHIPSNSTVVDFYSGVGAISIPLHKKISKAILVDSNEQAIALAQDNIINNKLDNFQAHCAPSERLIGEIQKDRIIIFDPPRAGLHKDVVDKVLRELPETIIYLSCNISTQARDLELLQAKYKIVEAKLYNYFPRTPHFESLIVLTKI